ncbi:RNA polymerase sigma-70 factor (ECF subfamily) [Chitinophaga skermanii]|uniref:RNA polymerase sigma factor n=1 Tax=Chitinophaga skermanii TaxID=331697 RepID=A0A327R5E6_9BACT|nr:RNA polymerase sigma-70 factor [Chitinophaga skermanii]RAJ11192.1 RNA polymerase sigma-70 factor (ECF subfamily) [Chitinophaga skermanii]
MVQPTDEELCEKIVNNDLPAFHTLYQKYSDAIFAYAFKLTTSREIALDVVQEVFLKVWVKQASLDPSLSIKAFLYKIAKNIILDQLKKAVHDEKFRQHFLESYEEQPATSHNDLYYKQLEEMRMQAIAQLPGQRQLIYKLSKLNGLSNTEIASQLGISSNTVKDQLTKASRFIRQYLYQHADIAMLVAVFTMMA